MLKPLAAALLIFASSSLAQASISDLSLAQPTPPSSTAEAEVGAYESPQKFSVGLGSGVNSFSGNIGKLYSSSSPVLDLRVSLAFNPYLSLGVGGDQAKYSFSAEPNGSVGVTTRGLYVTGTHHPLGTSLASAGFDPYMSLGAGQVFRSQNFHRHNTVENDNAFGWAASLGSSYLFMAGKAALWVEGGAGKVYFSDRYSAEYLESGVTDTTGTLLSARLGVKYYF